MSKGAGRAYHRGVKVSITDISAREQQRPCLSRGDKNGADTYCWVQLFCFAKSISSSGNTKGFSEWCAVDFSISVMKNVLGMRQRH